MEKKIATSFLAAEQLNFLSQIDHEEDLSYPSFEVVQVHECVATQIQRPVEIDCYLAPEEYTLLRLSFQDNW